MTKPGKMHFDLETDAGVVEIHVTPCRRMMPRSRVTEDPAAVTCGGCTRWLAARPLPEVEPLHEVTSRPAPAPQSWDEHGPGIVARSRAGDDGPRMEGWPSLDSALSAWWRVRSASLLGSSTRFDGGGGGPRTDHTPAAMSRAGRVLPVDRAVVNACASGHSFAGDEDGRGALRVPPHECRLIVGLYLEGKSASDTAARIATNLGIEESAVTERQIGQVWKRIRREVSRDLEGRGLLEPRAENRDTQEVKEGRMALPDGCDVQGWKAIADVLGISESQAREYDRRGELTMVRRCLGTVVADRASLRSWLSTRTHARRTG